MNTVRTHEMIKSIYLPFQFIDIGAVSSRCVLFAAVVFQLKFEADLRFRQTLKLVALP